MSVEGPHTSFPFADFQSSRSNVHPTKASRGVEVAYSPQQHFKPMKRSSPFTAGDSSMPVSTSSQSLLASIPSFMSVFGNGPDRLESNNSSPMSTEASGSTIKFSRIPNTFASSMIRRDSTSTFESVESSPTTTISTIESSLTEPSPSSPPESPESLLPYTSFKNLRTNSVPGRGIMEEKNHKDNFSSSFPILPGVERADSPNKKMRNMKNLSVNTSTSNRSANQLPKLGLSRQPGESHATSAPPTPAFIVPTQAPRRKPSQLGLTLTTPEAGSSVQAIQERPSELPSATSDHQIRTLRHLQTSSSGPLFSPTVAPEGGMRLPPFSSQPSTGRFGGFGKAGPPLTVSPRGSVDSNIISPITRQTLDHVQEETDYDVPLSQEVKSPAYPQGPVCIYDPLVYLYLEPSHVEARQFDVVLNVAREVLNPFTLSKEIVEQRAQVVEAQVPLENSHASFAGRNSISEPQTASSDRTFSSAFETQPDDAIRSVPSTPKATRPEPEYIHMPWDHNTNVVDDLLELCELIDNRVRQEKRVLVHCQCGVSRSASLVVAYGLYKNPQLTVQEAYDAVKNRSRWIGPNMNLIYQLSEFKSKLPKTHITGTAAWHSWKSLGTGRSNPNASLAPESHVGPSSSHRIPPPKALTDPFHSGGRENPTGRSNSFSPPATAQIVQTSHAGDITPGPSSAPPDMQWSPGKMPSAKNSDDGLATDVPTPPRVMNLDTEMILSPSSIGGEAIEEKEVAPAGGVAKDLQEVARDLNSSDHGLAATVSDPDEVDIDGHRFIILSPPRAMDIDTTQTTLARLSPPRDMDTDIDESISPTRTTPVATDLEVPHHHALPALSPTLPAGFSSLLSRRQAPLGLGQPRLGLGHLPLRQPEPPRLAPVLPPQRAFDPDVPPTPSILSPRAAEFTASPFHRTVAGDLAGSSVFEQGLMSPRAMEEDPRSPHQKGESEVVRSIFDMI